MGKRRHSSSSSSSSSSSQSLSAQGRRKAKSRRQHVDKKKQVRRKEKHRRRKQHESKKADRSAKRAPGDASSVRPGMQTRSRPSTGTMEDGQATAWKDAAWWHARRDGSWWGASNASCYSPTSWHGSTPSKEQWRESKGQKEGRRQKVEVASYGSRRGPAWSRNSSIVLGSVLLPLHVARMRMRIVTA